MRMNVNSKADSVVVGGGRDQGCGVSDHYSREHRAALLTHQIRVKVGTDFYNLGGRKSLAPPAPTTDSNCGKATAPYTHITRLLSLETPRAWAKYRIQRRKEGYLFDRARHSSTGHKMSLTNCRYYEEQFPEVDSFVMVNVKQVG
jgi:hypothetical protein